MVQGFQTEEIRVLLINCISSKPNSVVQISTGRLRWCCDGPGDAFVDSKVRWIVRFSPRYSPLPVSLTARTNNWPRPSNDDDLGVRHQNLKNRSSREKTPMSVSFEVVSGFLNFEPKKAGSSWKSGRENGMDSTRWNLSASSRTAKSNHPAFHPRDCREESTILSFGMNQRIFPELSVHCTKFA